MPNAAKEFVKARRMQEIKGRLLIGDDPSGNVVCFKTSLPVLRHPSSIPIIPLCCTIPLLTSLQIHFLICLDSVHLDYPNVHFLARPVVPDQSLLLVLSPERR